MKHHYYRQSRRPIAHPDIWTVTRFMFKEIISGIVWTVCFVAATNEEKTKRRQSKVESEEKGRSERLVNFEILQSESTQIADEKRQFFISNSQTETVWDSNSVVGKNFLNRSVEIKHWISSVAINFLIESLSGYQRAAALFRILFRIAFESNSVKN